MFMFNWSALMTPRRPPWTACVHFQLQHSLSVVTLGIYLGALPHTVESRNYDRDKAKRYNIKPRK
jgi:hypothetical protein